MKDFNPIKIMNGIKNEYDDFFKANFLVHNKEIIDRYERDINKDGFLWKGGYFSLTPTYKKSTKNLKEFLRSLVPQDELNDKDLDIFCEVFADSFRLYFHQEDALRNILRSKKNTIISTGTGSGKSLCYFLPILLHCIATRKNKGVKAIISYPMNALANDQLDILKNICFKLYEQGINIRYGMYIGATPKHENEKEDDNKTNKINGINTSCLFSQKDVDSGYLQNRPICRECIQKGEQEYFKADLINNKWKFRCSIPAVGNRVALDSYLITRKDIQNDPPDILITNFSMMELLLLRENDQPLFSTRTVNYLVLDEAHTHMGASGSHVACQMRRLISRLVRNQNHTPICIGTSATLTQIEDKTLTEDEKRKVENDAISKFASQLFGQVFEPSDVIRGTLSELCEKDESKIVQKQTFEIKDYKDADIATISLDDFRKIIFTIADEVTFEEFKNESRAAQLYHALLRNAIFWDIYEKLKDVTDYNSLKQIISPKINDKNNIDNIIWSYLFLGSQATNPISLIPLINLKTHLFIRPPKKLYVCPTCYKLYDVPKVECDDCKIPIRKMGICHGCGKIYFGINSSYKDIEDTLKIKDSSRPKLMESVININKQNKPTPSETDVESDEEDEENTGDFDEILPTIWFVPSDDHNAYYCISCGIITHKDKCNCEACTLPVYVYYNKGNIDKTSVRPCIYCDNKNQFSIVTETSQSFDVTIRRVIEILYNQIPDPKKLLFFIDNVQMAKGLPPTIEHVYLRSVLSQMATKFLRENDKLSYPLLYQKIIEELKNKNYLESNRKKQSYSYTESNLIDIGVKEILKLSRKRINPPNTGLIDIDYEDLTLENITSFLKSHEIGIDSKIFYISTRLILDEIRVSNLTPKEEGKVSEEYLKKSDKFADQVIFIKSRVDAENAWTAQGYDPKLDENKKQIGFYKNYLDFMKGYIDPRSNKYRMSSYDKIINKVIEINNLSFDSSKFLDLIIEFLIAYNLISESNMYTTVKLPSKDVRVLNLSKIIIQKPKELFYCEKCFAIKTFDSFGHCIGSYNSQQHTQLYKLNKINDTILSDLKYYRDLFTKQPSPLIAKDDTSSTEDRHKTEILFKKGGVNLVVASPTLELGVDIGDLNVVGLLRTPPSPSNYIQRVGRAGRDSKVSLALTIIKDEIIDNHYFNNPLKIISGHINKMELFLENEILIKHHAHSLILENISSKGLLPKKFIDLVNNDKYLKTIEEEIKNQKKNLILQIEMTFINDAKKGQFILKENKAEEFVNLFVPKLKDDAVGKFKSDMTELESRYKHLADMRNQLESDRKNVPDYSKKIQSINGELINLHKAREELEQDDVINYLKKIDFLPNYAFPSNTVGLMQIPAEKNRSSYYIRSEKTNMNPTEKNKAISLYSPFMKIIHNRGIYRSIGVVKPEDLQLFKYRICPKCKRYYEIKGETQDLKCVCGYSFSIQDNFNGLSPSKMAVEWVGKVEDRLPSDSFVVSEYYVEEMESNNSEEISLLGFNLKKPHFGNILNVSKSTLVKGVNHNYRICKHCGKILLPSELESGEHRNISKDSFGEYAKEDAVCKSEEITQDNSWSDKVYLFNKFPTRILRIKLTGENKPTVMQSTENYLVTMMNAIISASYTVTHAQEGEIDGFVAIDNRDKAHSIILFDKVEGGIGYVDLIYRNFNNILDSIRNILDETTNDYCNCDLGCPSCIMSSRRRYDARFIDKRLIKNFILTNYKPSIESKNESPEEYIKRPEIIASNAGELKGYDRIKNAIKESTESIDIVSMYVTDDQLVWSENEPSCSWIDLLVAKKRIDKVKMRVILRSPLYRKSASSIKKRQEELRKLLINGIEVKIFEKELDDGSIAIAHNKEVLVDPLLSTGVTFALSGNLSFESYKNNDRIEINTDFKIRRDASEEFNKLWNQSRDVISEIDLVEQNYEVVLIHDEKSKETAKNKVRKTIDEAKEEILISDPYLHNSNIWNFLIDWVRPKVNIKILTAFTREDVLDKALEKLKEKGINCEIVRYFDEDAVKKNKVQTILHKRYLVIDKKIFVDWDMGFNTILGNKYDNNITIFENNMLSKKMEQHFLSYFKQAENADEIIKNFPTQTYST